jgi:hypothetical protein
MAQIQHSFLKPQLVAAAEVAIQKGLEMLEVLVAVVLLRLEEQQQQVKEMQGEQVFLFRLIMVKAAAAVQAVQVLMEHLLKAVLVV